MRSEYPADVSSQVPQLGPDGPGVLDDTFVRIRYEDFLPVPRLGYLVAQRTVEGGASEELGPVAERSDVVAIDRVHGVLQGPGRDYPLHGRLRTVRRCRYDDDHVRTLGGVEAVDLREHDIVADLESDPLPFHSTMAGLCPLSNMLSS